MAWYQWNAFMCVAVCLVFGLSILPTCLAETHFYNWELSLVDYTRNCFTKPLMVVNGQYPGPTIQIAEGDRVVVNVTNSANYNVTIHWHGIRQLRSCWMDGTSYITECPIQPGAFKVYDFVVTGQRGTNFWHAHASWNRISVHGAFITTPTNVQYPYPKPYGDIPIILGEWYNGDVVQIEQQALATGAPEFPIADALTMDGLPGDQYNCSDSEGVATIDVQPGQTYLLRVINAAMQTELYFAIANHSLTVVEVDGNYVKPFTVERGIVIATGSYMNVLVTTNQAPGTYYMVGQPHSTAFITDFTVLPPVAIPTVLHYYPPFPTTGLFQYTNAPWEASSAQYPDIPAINDTTYSTNFWTSLKSLNPQNLDHDNVKHLLFIGGIGTQPCTFNGCVNPSKPSGMLNNVSWVVPTISVLQAYYENIPGVYSPTFPEFPPHPFDYTDATSPPLTAQTTEEGTRVLELEFGTVVELVIQGINYDFFEDHPMHLHGHVFYVLGQGVGNYDATSDSGNFNYFDPPARVSVNVPARGWVAIQFITDNPGTWLFHCHIERHMSWGMQMVFIVKDGIESNQTLPAPPRLNPC